ncbi:MAG: hypothetical protein B0D91_12455 [Oceanospirillales bacterium LUC14_002_19_P2]|nr:MAG: hypothetical protein B0D91_12455 [Oceanospirillales bacterium LUC14_002_19_P2]
MRHSCSAVLFSFLLFSTSLNAVPLSVDQKEQVYRAQLDIYRAATHFHLYTLLEGDRQTKEQLDTVVGQLQANPLFTDESEEQETSFKPVLSSYVSLIQSNEIASEGYTSVYTINDMEFAQSELLDMLESHAAGDEKHQALNLALLKSAVQMEKISTRYTRLAAHWNGRTGILPYPEGDTVDVHAQRLTEQLDSLLSRKDLPAELSETLAKVEKKWRFIAPKLMDYQNQTVPYLVSRYSESIVGQLMQAANE